MKRQIITIGQFAYIPLTQGYVATIDAADVHLVDKWNWTAFVRQRTVHVFRKHMVDGAPKNVWLHRVILGTPDGFDTDHVDGNGLNNTRSNLRVATRSQNNRNQRLASHNTSGHKGVSWHKKDKRWRACIHVNNKYVHLGHFIEFDDACAAYAKASAEMHQEFGRVV